MAFLSIVHSQKSGIHTLFGPSGLAYQLGCIEYSRPRRFRAKLAERLHQIRMIWPECPVALESNRLTIIPCDRMTNCTVTGSSENGSRVDAFYFIP